MEPGYRLLPTNALGGLGREYTEHDHVGCFGQMMATMSSTLYGQELNLHVNHDPTVRIRTLDRTFLKDLDLYVADSVRYLTAVLFDRRDGLTIVGPYRRAPLTSGPVEDAIQGIRIQYASGNWVFVKRPQAINMLNMQEVVVGCVYTSLKGVMMRRSPPGQVTVYKPRRLAPRDRGGT